MRGSIIVPAHNEAAVLERCLRRLPLSSYEVIVVCNGCKDQTAQLARSFSEVKVEVLERAGKAAALNHGDRMARYFPRFYVDADIEVGEAAIERVRGVLLQGQALVAAPRISVELGGCHWAIESFYRVWLELPYASTNMVGSGFYALSQQGRARFDAFPELIADDEFVRRQFNDDERCCLEDCCFRFWPPREVKSFLWARARQIRGVRQLRQSCPKFEDELGLLPKLGAFFRLFARPKNWLPCLTYLVLWSAAQALAGWQERSGEATGDWHSDLSSRQRPAGSSAWGLADPDRRR